MNNLLDLLEGQFSEGMIDQLSNQLGGAEKEKTAKAASGIMNTLLGGLAKNASTTEGANALNNALDRDHDGSVLDDIMDIVTGNKQLDNQKAVDGQGIVNHILGDRQSNAIQMISKLSGLEQNKTGNLMTMLAPMLMGALGKTKKQNGLDAAGLVSLLSGTVGQQKQQDPTMSLITRFLDSDGDGSIMDEVAGIGMKFLGSLFRRK